MTVQVSSTTEPLSYSVKLAQVSDATDIAALGANVFDKSFGWSMPAQDMQDYLATSYSTDRIQEELEQTGTYRFFVARDQVTNRLLGFVQLNLMSEEPCLTIQPPLTIELQRIYTDITAHGRGVGSALMTTALEYAASSQYKAIWLGVWEHNLKAHKFYQRNHFQKVGTHDFKMGSCVHIDWILERPI